MHMTISRISVTNPPYSNDGYHLSLSLSQRNPGQLMDDEEVHQGNVDHNVRLLPRLDRDGGWKHLHPCASQLHSNPTLLRFHNPVHFLRRSLEEYRQQEYE